MPGEEGHSDCKCSQNIDFFEQILNGKNPLEDWLKKEIEKLLPNDLKYFVKLFDIIYDDNSKQSEINIVAPDKLERNHTVGNNMIINTKIMNDYINTGFSKNAIMKYTVTDDHIMDVKAGKTMTYNYSCADYNSNLMIGNNKYVMKAVNLQDLIGKEFYVYVKDNSNRNLAENDNSVNNEGNIKLIYRNQGDSAGKPALNPSAEPTDAGIKVGDQLTRAGDYYQQAAKGFFNAGAVFDLVDRLDLDSRLSDLRGAADKAAKAGSAATAEAKQMWEGVANDDPDVKLDLKGVANDDPDVKLDLKGAANADLVFDTQSGAFLADAKLGVNDHPSAK